MSAAVVDETSGGNSYGPRPRKPETDHRQRYRICYAMLFLFFIINIFPCFGFVTNVSYLFYLSVFRFASVFYFHISWYDFLNLMYSVPVKEKYINIKRVNISLLMNNMYCLWRLKIVSVSMRFLIHNETREKTRWKKNTPCSTCKNLKQKLYSSVTKFIYSKWIL